jgi:glutathione S-transferase
MTDASIQRLRVHRIPFSTNVERVALAAGYKGLAVEWVDHDPADRSAIRELSGQELVPVAELGGEVLSDSSRIVDRIEQLVPEPPLYPAAAALRARVLVFVEWFNGVWKGPPNAIAAGDSDPELVRRLTGSLELFDGLLSDGDHLFGDFGVADVTAFPFVRYATLPDDPADTDPFHAVLREHLAPCPPRGRDWIARVDERPRA